MMSQLQTSLDHHSDDAYEMMKKTACKSTANGHGKTSIDTKASCDWFRGLFGFSVVDLSSQDHIMRLLFRPMDPAGLGFTRIIFGLLMLVDLWQERGLHEALDEYGDTSLCRFPLFNIWPVLPLQWIYIVYFIMFLGEVGIVLGLFYRVSCLMFVVPYWYLFLLDKTSWNNHSYLYGLCGILLLVTDTNHVWSVDGLLDSKKRNAHIPLWNYAIFRFQIFVLYFIAGLKKLDPDWILGYSMHYITGHWVFSPFRLFLTDGQMSVFIIHLGGLFIDLFIGFLLFFDQTRKYAIFVGSSFHGMNSQLFSIGMFPFVCLSTLPLFCDPGWPRLVIDRLPAWMTTLFKQESSCTTNPHCLYHKEHIKPDEKQPGGQLVTSCDPPPHTKAHGYHKAAAMFCVAYVSTQCFLPYSHFITQGYNHWAQGLYGYSWDMMVHSWKLQHIKITYIDKLTREEGYLNPKVWTLGARWSSHADMIKQYAACVEERLAGYNVTDIELHMDVWRALNGRFQQRAVDPRVDLIVAPWNPFQLTPWLFPLLVDLSDWRGKLVEIERDIFQQDSDTDVVFVADFPGLYLENYVQPELGNTSVTVLHGRVVVELVDQARNYTLQVGEKMQLPPNEFHNIHTVSESPSCYMYIFVNTTEVGLKHMVDKYEQIMNGTFTGTDKEVQRVKHEIELGKHRVKYQQFMTERQRTQEEFTMPVSQRWSQFWGAKWTMFYESFRNMFGAVKCLVIGKPFEEYLNDTYSASTEKNRHKDEF